MIAPARHRRRTRGQPCAFASTLHRLANQAAAELVQVLSPDIEQTVFIPKREEPPA